MARRNLYLSNTPVEEALSKFLAVVTPHLRVRTEKIEVWHSLDRVTAEAVYARCNSPLYNCAAMDGIAVISGHTRGASEPNPITLEQGRDFIQVDTGDPVWPPYDSVIMAEDLLQTDDGVVIRMAAAPWQHIRPVGEDIIQGEMILPTGHKIRPVDVGVLLSGGITSLSVLALPKVGIIPTGSEMVEPGRKVPSGGIIESNSYMLAALVKQGGGLPERLPLVPDEQEKLKEVLKKSAQEFDIVLVIAGTSAGREDFTAPILRELGEVVVHGVAIKPGKPVILAAIGGKPVIGLPGYPVSAYLAYQNFAAPVIAEISGRLREEDEILQATLTRKLVSSLKHREYLCVKLGKVKGKFIATPLARGAGSAMSLVRADGFCVIEQDVEGVQADERVNILLSRGLDGLEKTIVSIGSHDLILDLLADLIPRLYRGVSLSSTHVGSMGGLLALKGGEAHIAPFHLLDEESGKYNIPTLKKLFVGQKMALIKGVGRVQGIMVEKGNPLGIAGLEDLVRCSYINRQRGAGTRLLLDYKLLQLGLKPTEIPGYEREATTHMAVAAAIKNGGATAGLGIFPAAMAMGLDFIPIGEEEYDFALPQEFLDLEHIQTFIESLKNEQFLARVEKLGSYTTQRCGEVIPVEC